MTMDATNFAYWLNGFAELNGDTPPTAEQWKAIREHLALVFEKVTPPVALPYGGEPDKPPRERQKADPRIVDWLKRQNINPVLRWPPDGPSDVWAQPPSVQCSETPVNLGDGQTVRVPL